MTDQASSPTPPSKKTILYSVGGALIGAVVVLVLFVLPAETGFDPIGTGRLLGLTGLANPPSPAFTAQASPLRHDEVEFELGPFQSIEYKYQLAEGAGLTFAWTTEAPVYFDMHAEPEGAEEGYAETFATGDAARQDGVYIATFPGIHGWFWQNRNQEAVTVRLTSSGFYTGAIIFDGGGETPRDLPE